MDTSNNQAGLTAEIAQRLLLEQGLNQIPQDQSSTFTQIVKKIISPISLMLLLASLLSFYLGHFFDGYFILFLLGLNQVITIWQEWKADQAIKKLNDQLTQKIKVLRDKKWQFIDAKYLVTGDLIELSSGEIVPVDGVVTLGRHLMLNESAVSGESLPKDAKEGDLVFSGTYLTTGIAWIKVTATGKNTRFGKTILSVERVRKQSLLEKDIISISRYLTILSIVAITVLSSVLYFLHYPVLELLTLDLSLLIAGVPISLPTVLTLIIEFGVLSLAAKKVIVRRLSALEEFANVNFLLTDKTGTLTKNEISVQDIYSYGSFNHHDVLYFSLQNALQAVDDPINKAIISKAAEFSLQEFGYHLKKFIPADSERKHSTLVALDQNNKRILISVGTPQIIAQFCDFSAEKKDKFEREVEMLATKGDRTLAIAIKEHTVSEEEKKMDLVGILALSDSLRADAKEVIHFLRQNGISVAMVTGDNHAIAKQIAHELSLDGEHIVRKTELDTFNELPKELFLDTAAFAEVLPEDKFKLVQQAKRFFVIAANGDGVNDLPAIKAAHVGIAVASAVSILKSTADIVLLSEGISVIKDAIIESRKIFERVYTYSVYRISESFRLIVTITILGLFYHGYPLTALQIILIALLNDIPIISLAFDRVKITNRPDKINVKNRLILSSLFGMVGVVNSLLLFFLVNNILHLSWPVIQTIYFLKLTVSGHMLLFVAHTKDRWYHFLPSKEVVIATVLTQLVATFLALSGLLMPSRISIFWVIFVWGWALLFMQISEVMKMISQKVKV